MRSFVDSPKKRKLSRVARDYRAVIKKSEYPGFERRKPHSASKEADDNLHFVWTNPPKPSRYGDGLLKVLYAAPTKQTCYVEVGYHLQEWFLASKKRGTTLKVAHICYQLEATGNERDLSSCVTDLQMLCGSNNKAHEKCRSIAKQAKADYIDFLRVPSARRIGSISQPILSKSSVTRAGDVEEIELHVNDNIRNIGVRKAKRIRKYKVDRTY